MVNILSDEEVVLLILIKFKQFHDVRVVQILQQVHLTK